MNDRKVFLGCPTHDGRMESAAADIFYSAASKDPVIIMNNQSSALTANCNHLYATALNYKKHHPLKWFALLHSDVIPEEFFVDKLIALAEQHEADFMSAVIPIKDQRGVTSTGFLFGNSFHTRITQKQLWNEHMPATFDGPMALAAIEKMGQSGNMFFQHNVLLANTGCMVVRLDKDWSEKLFFTIEDQIYQGEDGLFKVRFFPEDWNFSLMVNNHGGKVMCTREVLVKHAGGTRYSNHEQWGHFTDPETKY